jgi:hypothetical protein
VDTDVTPYLAETPEGALVEVHDQTSGPAYLPWQPTDLGQAEWAMGQLRAIDAELGALGEQYDLWLDQLEQWSKRVEAGPLRRRQFFEQALTQFADALRQLNPAGRSLPLPSGTVAATVPRSGKVVVTDDELLLAWLHGRERQTTMATDAIKRTPDTVRLPELRRLLSARHTSAGWRVVDAISGELLGPEQGVEVEPPGEATYRVNPGR